MQPTRRLLPIIHKSSIFPIRKLENKVKACIYKEFEASQLMPISVDKKELFEHQQQIVRNGFSNWLVAVTSIYRC